MTGAVISYLVLCVVIMILLALMAWIAVHGYLDGEE